jgi:hypothetical protein
MRTTRWFATARGLAGLALVALLAGPGHAGTPGKADPDGYTDESVREMLPEYFHVQGNGRAQPAAVPDVFGPGAVLTVGQLYMKVTNWGHVGNFWTNLSSDPAGQWPGASSVEYLSTIRLSVGAKNPLATDPTAIRRVSYMFEWRPPTLAAEDRIYRSYDGIVNGLRYVNDDHDADPLTGEARIDEDFADGRDNDNDTRFDEDYGALGQQMFSLVMRDDTREAINATYNEKHVPLGLEVRQVAWAYSISQLANFNAVEYTVFNRSGHTLDSLVIGWLVDMDCGPVEKSNFFQDDLDCPTLPNGEFPFLLPDNDARRQFPHSASLDNEVAPDSALCPLLKVRLNGFSIADDDGDEARTPGVPSFLLLGHTLDPLGQNGPSRVGFRAFRSFTSTTPFIQGGNPRIDQERYEFMTSTQNVDPETGLQNATPGDQKGDQVQWCSIGPWLNVPDGGSVQATIAFAVQNGSYRTCTQYANDYMRYRNGTMMAGELFEKYPVLRNAFDAQVAYEGSYESREGFPVPDFHGRETALKAAPGTFFSAADCRDQSGGRQRPVNDRDYTWFDFDCDYCTGVWVARTREGLHHATWTAEAPPPNPNTNLAVSYNFADNPYRTVNPAGDRTVELAWDNLSEVTADPKSGWLDFRGYRIWKVANWTRPVGAAGPQDEDWSLLAEFRKYDYSDSNFRHYRDGGLDTLDCPKVFIPSYLYPDGRRDTATVKICLRRGDLWDRQSGRIIRPEELVQCLGYPGPCQIDTACVNGTEPCARTPAPPRYPVGRYRYVDREVKNGFIYFYSITAFDSTKNGSYGGRQAAVEAEGVVPQGGPRPGKGVWVVPNPYRGYSRIAQRPSAWDLTPNASDPTGTHVDFLGMPRGRWTLKIFSVAGDLVAELHSYDAVNESVRGTVTVPNPHFDPNRPADPVTNPQSIDLPGYNRQQDNPDDGQARWNLISRNGQDVVSGIYLFTVESSQGTQRGKFVIIR